MANVGVSRLKKLPECDTCHRAVKPEPDGHQMEHYSDDYSSIIREYWLCNPCFQEYWEKYHGRDVEVNAL